MASQQITIDLYEKSLNQQEGTRARRFRLYWQTGLLGQQRNETGRCLCCRRGRMNKALASVCKRSQFQTEPRLAWTS